MKEFEIQMEEFKHIICLQDIKDFAYVLKVEYLSEDENSLIHERYIRGIFKKLNVEPINPKEFNERISRYITANRKLL